MRSPSASMKNATVEPVPTPKTAAGDTFLGALSSELKPDLSNLRDSVIYASKSSSFTVQKLGAFPSIPTREVVEEALKEKNNE